MAILAATTVNLWKSKGDPISSPEDFIPEFRHRPPKTEEDTDQAQQDKAFVDEMKRTLPRRIK